MWVKGKENRTVAAVDLQHHRGWQQTRPKFRLDQMTKEASQHFHLGNFASLVLTVEQYSKLRYRKFLQQSGSTVHSVRIP